MQALQRLLAILEVVANTPGGATATQVSTGTDLSLSTTSRLLQQLVGEGVLDRSDRGGAYTIGWRLVSIARDGSDRFDVRERVRPILEGLRDLSGETSSLHTRSGTNRICIAAAQSHQAVARTVPVGLSLGLVGSATGVVLLAGTSAAERDQLFPSMNDEERADLEASIDLVRERGWLLVADAWQTGVTGISAAVRKGDGDIVAALSVSGPSARFRKQTATSLSDRLLDAAREVSALYGREL